MRKDSSLVNCIADDGIRPVSYDPLQSFLFSVDGPFSSIFFLFFAHDIYSKLFWK